MSKRKDQSPKIKLILQALYSERDLYGNCYWALRAVDTETGARAEGSVSGGESNISAVVREMGLQWDQVFFFVQGMGKREFKRHIANWPYAGCRPEELVSFIHGSWWVKKR